MGNFAEGSTIGGKTAAFLEEDGKLSISVIPPLSYVSTGSGGKISADIIPPLNYIIVGTALDASTLQTHPASYFAKTTDIPVIPTIINALTETVAGKTLDATQGKTLNDRITTVDTRITNLTKSSIGLGNVNNVVQMPIAGGTFTGVATGYASTSYTTRQLRNVIMSTADPSGGSNGDIWIKYE